MMNYTPITDNEIISGVCKAISSVYGTELTIYKEKRQDLKLPAVTVYCINRSKTMERFDRFTNIFNIIINYFPQDSVKINNKRMDMSIQAEKIMEAIKYIPLPAYKKNSSGDYTEITRPSRASGVQSEENEGFIQISARYTVRTKQISDDAKMRTMDYKSKLK